MGALPVTDLRLRSRNVVLGAGVGPATVAVRDGVIAAIASIDDSAGPDDTDLGDAVLMPGVVDTHVHVNEPGRTEWEGFETATRAAAAGGVTTIVDMPLNSSPVTTSVGALEAKADAARGKCRVDYGFWGGVVPGNQAELPGLVDAGVLGFKCFLTPSGIDEFEHVTENDLDAAMPVLLRRGAVLLAHAEDPACLREITGDHRSYASYLASRPPASEERAIATLIRLCERHGTAVHVVHLSAASAVDPLRAARARGLPVTVETCPHYLHFAAGDIPDGATAFKCAPPIRDGANRERLWNALADGVIDLVASDHSPSPPALEAGGDFAAAWGGIASLQLGLPVVWTGAAARGHTLSGVAAWMCAAPARLAGLDSKGRIEVGCDADLVVFDPDATQVVTPDALHHRHPMTPYTGTTLRGTVRQTYVRGRLVYDDGRFPGSPHGRQVSRHG